MTTNLVDSINFVLKKTRNLPISSMVMATYTRCNKFFRERSRQVEVMMIVGHVYFEVAAKALEDAQSKANTHTVLSFDRRSTRFLIEERQNPRKVRPPGRFAVCLDELWCDCGKFQKLHLPCFGNLKNFIYHTSICLLHANMYTTISVCTSHMCTP